MGVGRHHPLGGFPKVPLIGAQKLVPFETHCICKRCSVKLTLVNIFPSHMLNGMTEFLVPGYCVPCAKAMAEELKEQEKTDD